MEEKQKFFNFLWNLALEFLIWGTNQAKKHIIITLIIIIAFLLGIVVLQPDAQNFFKSHLKDRVSTILSYFSIDQSTYKAGDTFQDCKTCPEMVVVPSGSLKIKIHSESKNGQKVTIPKPFAVSKYEVTRGQFEEFIIATNREMKNGCGIFQRGDWSVDTNAGWNNPRFTQFTNHPVVCVSWNDAQAYIRWLSNETGHQYRLLTGVEWEYISQIGTVITYYFDPEIFQNLANHGQKSKGTVSVGNYPANKFGLHDIYGNVSEWVEDCLSDCSKNHRMAHGGSWASETKDLRSDVHEHEINLRFNDHGLRIARNLTP